MTRNELIEKATSSLDEARASDDIGRRDTLIRVASAYTQLLNFIESPAPIPTERQER